MDVAAFESLDEQMIHELKHGEFYVCKLHVLKRESLIHHILNCFFYFLPTNHDLKEINIFCLTNAIF